MAEAAFVPGVAPEQCVPEVCVRSLFGLPERGSRRPRIKVETATTGGRNRGKRALEIERGGAVCVLESWRVICSVPHGPGTARTRLRSAVCTAASAPLGPVKIAVLARSP